MSSGVSAQAWLGLGAAWILVAALAVVSARRAIRRRPPGVASRDIPGTDVVTRGFTVVSLVVVIIAALLGAALSVIVYAILALLVVAWLCIVVLGFVATARGTR